MYQPLPQLLAQASTRQPGPVTQTDSIQKADILEMAIGLRAIWKQQTPASKPAAPVVVTQSLPTSTPAEHVARRAAQIKGSTFLSLARCEQQAWAELSYSASNEQVWVGSRSLKGMPAVSSIEHTGTSMDEDPDELGLYGVTDLDALDQLAQQEQAAWQTEIIRTALSDREWLAICMKADGLPDAEIAKALGASLPTTWKVIRKARAKAKLALS